MTVPEMQVEIGKLVKQMREINDLAKKEKRSFTADEQAKYTALEADLEKKDGELKAEEKRTADEVARDARLNDLDKHLSSAPPPVARPSPSGHRAGAAPAEGAEVHPYAKYLRFMPAGYRTPEYREAFEMALSGESAVAQKRADTLQVGLFAKGGALQPPQEFIAELLKFVDDTVFVRQFARIFRLERAESLGVPNLDTDLDDADWTSELLTGNQGDVTLSKRELRTHPLAKRVKVSKTLRRVSAIPIDQLVLQRLQYKFAVTGEKAYLTGDGVQKPLGIFTADANGIPTSRDVSTDNTATEIKADGLINAKYFMKAAYHRLARWAFHRDAVRNIRKLKDGNGQYLWQPGIANGGQPNSILDLPYDISEFAPNTFTTGLYVGALAVWPFYWIADALDMTVQVVDQLYAETNQDGFIGRMETDGMPVLAEAFVRVKLA